MAIYDDLIENQKSDNLAVIIKHANKNIVRIAEKGRIDYLDRETIKDLIALSIMLALAENMKETPAKWKEHVKWFKEKYKI